MMKRCLYLLLCTTPLMGMEYSAPLTKKELIAALNKQNNDLRSQKILKDALKKHLRLLKNRQKLPLEKSQVKQVWLKQNVGKSIYDFDQELQSLINHVQNDLYNTNQMISAIHNNIDALQRQLDAPQRDFRLGAD